MGAASVGQELKTKERQTVVPLVFPDAQNVRWLLLIHMSWLQVFLPGILGLEGIILDSSRSQTFHFGK